ncbi:uncharacterized protein LOC143052813 [Mytilus galloprovincialis]|uniref:uncharacterized protein LOC143052813 n=1 Tax=Mytilus galloprovincialis TaxID=29158 RepID=UPI003F7C318B
MEIEEKTFEDCKQLKTLDLSANLIEYIQPTTFKNLTSLQVLHLYDNELSTIAPFTFINLPSLRDLHLTRNNIRHIREQAFGYLPPLSQLVLSGNPLNCDCSIFPLWSWLIERSSIATNAQCSNGTLITSLQSPALEICNPDNCHCFNGGKCVANGNELACDCIGQWTGAFCQESPCVSHDCGFGNCYIEPVNGTAQCLCADRHVNFCPGM